METTVSKIFIKLDSVTATDNQTSPAHHHETKIHGDQKETIATKDYFLHRVIHRRREK
jgi:hypothetical protein